MWLLPALSRVARLVTGTYYSLTIDGAPVPRGGPVLLVGNHPNSLLDPALLAAAAGRPVRFLAKAPLFAMPQLGWLMRAAGCIPVYRRLDDPAQMARNVDSLAAAEVALAEGSAIGLFPEGISHHEPALAPLKTGAARIAL
ncbi:MAG TPA: 1-acyl-sn-glycerol-3-phosphate acyltransferase, partial [Gemmatimonadaceae bacterium]|nr:1-acyl-sn-glycerol-3-phosphate acyltransferase [Gemmatimonadaceae bacterium]